MPNIKRRSFLQILGAAGLSPFLPAMPVRAVAASGGASVSKALWAGIYANSGSMTNFVGVAKNMGLSNSAIQGIGARSIGVRVALTTTGNLAGSNAKSALQLQPSHKGKLNFRDNLKRTFENYFSDESDDSPTVVERKASQITDEKSDEETLTHSPDDNIQA